MRVDDGIILLAGKGTRMFPASMYCPKEFLPLIETPVMHHLVWEIIRAGVKRIHLVTSKEKLPFVKRMIDGDIKIAELKAELNPFSYKPIPDDVEIIVHIQHEPLGVGEAISIGCKSISGPFLVILGDNVLMNNSQTSIICGPSNASNASSILVEKYSKIHTPCVGVIKMPDIEISKYGVIEVEKGLLKNVIEKPMLHNAPSNLVLCGRYLFPSGSYEIIQKIRNSDNDEELSINFIKYLIDKKSISVVELNDFYMCDSGDSISWLKSQEKVLSKRIN